MEAPSIAAINAWAPLLEVLPLLMEKTLHSASGSEMVKNVSKIKVALPFTTDDQKTAKLLDNTSNLKSNNPWCSPIKNLDDFTKITNTDKYVMELHTIIIKKQFVFFILLESNCSFHKIKFNMKMFEWLKENKH
jgi:hypothetical protein